MEQSVKLEIGFATIGQGAGPMMVTWRAGLFQKYGLDIDRPHILGSAGGVVRALMRGDIQFGNMAAPAPLRANLLGEADIVFLTGGINQQFVLGRPGIGGRNDLAGKKFGFVGDGGLNDALVKFVIDKLEAAGLGRMHTVAVPGGGKNQLLALLSGACDAIVSTPPESIEAHRHGCNYLIDFAEYGLNYALGGIAARRDYVQKNPGITGQFIKAYVSGMQRYRNDREFTVQVQADYSGLEDSTIAEETYDLTRPGMPLVPYPVVSALQVLLNSMAAELPQARNADARRYIDDRFVRVLDEGGLSVGLEDSRAES